MKPVPVKVQVGFGGMTDGSTGDDLLGGDEGLGSDAGRSVSPPGTRRCATHPMAASSPGCIAASVVTLYFSVHAFSFNGNHKSGIF